jgi:hypothetical protein
VTELLAERLSQLDIDYADRGAGPLAAGRRADPARYAADDLSWTVLHPDGADDSVLVRPDGIIAETRTAAARFGIDPASLDQGARA